MIIPSRSAAKDDSAGGCDVFGKKYRPGEEFVNPGCSSFCKCRGPGVFCVSLCPPAIVKCNPLQVEADVNVPVFGGCTCPRKKCVTKRVDSPSMLQYSILILTLGCKKCVWLF